MEFLEAGVKVRIRGKRADCEQTAKRILKGSPTVASEQGAKYMIEGNLSKSFLRKGTNQQGPDANGVYTREDNTERTFTAFGENLPAVQAACRTACREDSMFTIVVNDRSAGPIVISFRETTLRVMSALPRQAGDAKHAEQTVPEGSRVRPFLALSAPLRDPSFFLPIINQQSSIINHGRASHRNPGQSMPTVNRRDFGPESSPKQRQLLATPKSKA